MKSLVVYDSVQGNTEEIALSIATGLGGGAKALRVASVTAAALQDVDLIVIGSPTMGGRPTPAIQAFVAQAAAGPQAVKVAAFDTRLTMKFAKLFGYAAARISEQLTVAGRTLTLPPEGFIVKGRSGPLAEGETARAEQWGKSLAR
jgi:flavodoxin